MHTINTFTLMASTYGSGAYNTSTYNGAQTVTGQTTGTSGGGATLTNTGIAVGMIVGIAALLLLIAILVRVWKRPRRSSRIDNDTLANK